MICSFGLALLRHRSSSVVRRRRSDDPAACDTQRQLSPIAATFESVSCACRLPVPVTKKGRSSSGHTVAAPDRARKRAGARFPDWTRQDRSWLSLYGSTTRAVRVARYRYRGQNGACPRQARHFRDFILFEATLPSASAKSSSRTFFLIARAGSFHLHHDAPHTIPDRASRPSLPLAPSSTQSRGPPTAHCRAVNKHSCR